MRLELWATQGLREVLLPEEAWRAKGIRNRMEFFRGAIGHHLAHLGARDAAVLFTNAGAAGA